MKAYARTTKVAASQTKRELERLVREYGATEFSCGWQRDKAGVEFVAGHRRIRFAIPIPKGDEREERRRWRSLLLAIKGRLVSVADQVETLEQAFLAHVVMEDGLTIFERITQASANGRPMLPPVGGAS